MTKMTPDAQTVIDAIETTIHQMCCLRIKIDDPKSVAIELDREGFELRWNDAKSGFYMYHHLAYPHRVYVTKTSY